jgi:hypothetical protein
MLFYVLATDLLLLIIMWTSCISNVIIMYTFRHSSQFWRSFSVLNEVRDEFLCSVLDLMLIIAFKPKSLDKPVYQNRTALKIDTILNGIWRMNVQVQIKWKQCIFRKSIWLLIVKHKSGKPEFCDSFLLACTQLRINCSNPIWWVIDLSIQCVFRQFCANGWWSWKCKNWDWLFSFTVFGHHAKL